MIDRLLILVVLLSMASPGHATKQLFPDQFDYRRYNQLAGPDLLAQDWQEDGKYSLSIRYQSRSAETFYQGEKEVAGTTIQDDYTFLATQYDHRQLDVTVTSGISATSNFVLRIGAVDKTIHLKDDAEGTTKVQKKGLKDIYAGFVIKAIDTNDWRMNMHLGMFLPVALTNISGTVGGDSQTLGYVMQHGSNSASLMPGLGVSRYFYRWSAGLEATAVIPLYPNDLDYLLGKEMHLKPWVSTAIGKSVSVYAMGHYQKVERPKSAHPNMDASLAWTRDSRNVGGSSADIAVGAYLQVDWWRFAQYRLFIEQRIPVYRNLNGTQLQHEQQLSFGLRFQPIKK